MDHRSYDERLYYLLELIDKGRLANKQAAAKKFYCSTRTINRMLNHLREKGHDIHYSHQLKKFFKKNHR